MKIERNAVLTLTSPLHHGAEKSRIKPENLPEGAKNNYQPHRRLPLLLKNEDGANIVEIPAVSGNSIRNRLRNILTEVTLHILNIEKKDLPKNVLETFTSGGGMDAADAEKNENEEEKQEKAKSKKKAIEPSVPILIRDRETLRAAIPMLSLFGCSYGNRMVESIAKVGWAIPAFKQTEHITNVKSDIPYSSDITSFQLTTRMATRDDHMSDEFKSRQGIFYVEVTSPGIPFHHWYRLENSTPIERSAMQLAIDLFKENAFLGGKSGTGMGKVSTDQWYEDLDVDSSLYIDFLKKNKDVIVEYINLWNQPEKIVRVENKKEVIEFPTDLSVELDRLIKEREEMLLEERRKKYEKLVN